MRVRKHAQYMIAVGVVDSLQFDADEAAFLREMARHCVETRMRGSAACESLIKALDAARVPEYHGGPCYGIFEEEK